MHNAPQPISTTPLTYKCRRREERRRDNAPAPTYSDTDTHTHFRSHTVTYKLAHTQPHTYIRAYTYEPTLTASHTNKRKGTRVRDGRVSVA